MKILCQKCYKDINVVPDNMYGAIRHCPECKEVIDISEFIDRRINATSEVSPATTNLPQENKVKRILIIDEFRDVAECTQFMLGLKGYSTILAYGGWDGIKIAVSNKPDLIIMSAVVFNTMDSINLSRDITGIEASWLLLSHTETKDIPIIGYCSSHTESKFKSVGVNNFLKKPFVVSELYATVEALIGGNDGSLEDDETADDETTTNEEYGVSSMYTKVKALQNKDEDAQHLAIRKFAEMKCSESKEVVPSLFEILKDRNSEVRADTAFALGLIGADAYEAAPALIETLRDDYENVRYHATYALSKMGNRAINSLIQTLKDEDRYVRKSAAFALGNIGAETNKVVSALNLSIYEDADEDVRNTAEEALEKITGKTK